MSTGGTGAWQQTVVDREIERLNASIDRKKAQITELKIEIGRLLQRLKRHEVEESESEDE
jgi:hypothetical protein